MDVHEAALRRARQMRAARPVMSQGMAFLRCVYVIRADLERIRTVSGNYQNRAYIEQLTSRIEEKTEQMRALVMELELAH